MPFLTEIAAQERAEKDKSLARENLEEQIRWHDRYRITFESTRQGIATLKDLERFTGNNATSAIPRPGGYDPIEMAIREGRRQVYLYIKSRLTKPEEANDE